MVLVGQRFEGALSRKIELVFFIPMIVYMSDIIGTETLALFVRELSLRKVSLHKIFWREVFVGFSLGLITGIPIGAICLFLVSRFRPIGDARYYNDSQRSSSRIDRSISPDSFCKAEERSRIGY